MDLAVTSNEESIEIKTKTNALSSVFSEYCNKTSLHGIGYLGDRDKSRFEKAWWIIMFMLSVTVCTFQITNTWTKWNENPVIISISETQIPIWTIPFPAVTICPFNKIDRRKYQYKEEFNFFKNNNFSQLDEKFWDVALLCNIKTNNYSLLTTEKVIQNICEVSTHSDSSIKWAKLNGKVIKFYNHVTEDGLCYTYNSLNQEEMYTNEINPKTKLIFDGYKNEGWNIETGYPENTETYRTYPNRTRDGVKMGMHIQLLSFVNSRELFCGDSILGYKITLHNPVESPRGGQQYILVPINKSAIISVKPKVMSTSRSLQSLPVYTRNCYFSHEKTLRFFNVYTQGNCRSECVINVTKELCGCVAFYMPRDNFTKICGTMDCINDFESDILPEFDVLHKNKKLLNFAKAFQIYNECDCLPSCASLDYDYDSSQADYNWFKKNDNKSENNTSNWREYTSVNIFFKESQFMAMYRKELYGQTDFLANCGGLLGLFLGFSFLSLIEIIYFFTMRLWCKIHRKKKVVTL